MKLPAWVAELAAKWRDEADAYARDGVAVHGLLGRVADELEARAEDYVVEVLTLEQAAEESGYSYSHLQRLVSTGEIPNLGKPGSPRVRRAALPTKPAHRSVRAEPRELEVRTLPHATEDGGASPRSGSLTHATSPRGFPGTRRFRGRHER